MILYVKNANFSGNNIGKLDTFFVYKKIGGGTTHDIPNTVARGAECDWTITVVDGYTFIVDKIDITMGDSTGENNVDVDYTVNDDKTITIHIGSVTGGISINVPTEEEVEEA